MPYLRGRTGAPWIRCFLQRCALTARPHFELISFLGGAVIIGALLSILTHQIQPDERVIVGNTGGTLTALVDLQDARILVGAGATRSHSADLIGRTTRPWEREIDLLVLPGWDDHHVSGALGLLERNAVRGVAIIGIPGDEPLWTLLEREAESRGIDIAYLDQTGALRLGSDTSLTLSELERSESGAWIRLEHRGKRIDIMDANDTQYARPDLASIDAGGEHVFVNMRGHSSPFGLHPELLIIPTPHWQGDFKDLNASHWSSIDRNQHITLTLDQHTIRIPVEAVQVRPDS